ncbi:MAG: carboxylating nicotinate-nucleotide diphosphorylase [Desulfobacteraceae bacterium]|jgi:nicotinate-nucleotide pyrophosphorylase (carboxylating)
MYDIDELINLALNEDIGLGDITTENLISPDACGSAIIVAKEALIICGFEVARKVFHRLDPSIKFTPKFSDGDTVSKGQTVLTMEGNLTALLSGERTALNFMQRLSGIATLTRSYVKLIQNTAVRLVDTRKTTPGLRSLEKYAVRMGGGANHRTGLYDGVLIKDNHIAACGGIHNAVTRIRPQISHLIKIEVEVTGLNEVREALAAKADVIMLDNMNVKQIKEAVTLIDGQAIVEVSGGVTAKNLVHLAETGVDLISVGALTHSARAMDLSMRIELST